MRRGLCVGVLRETKNGERRAPLTPPDVEWLISRGISVEVESSSVRIFKDSEYKKSGAVIVNKFRKASLLVGIKPPYPQDVYADKIYMLFSHTHKGQQQGMSLLKSFFKNRVTLIDYEKIVGPFGRRRVYFGGFAGICGMIDSLHYYGKKLHSKGLKNPFSSIKPAHQYRSLKSLRQSVIKAGKKIRSQGVPREISPLIIGVTGHGNVSEGAQEVLELLGPVEIHPRQMREFVRHQKGMQRRVYKIVFLREEKIRAKDKKSFYFEEYLKNPKRFESNLDQYIPYLNMLIHGSYWDKEYPRLVTLKMINNIARRRRMRLEFIGDISCDINGSVELTYKAGCNCPVYTYDPIKKSYHDGYKARGITIFAIDNLPSELPLEASAEFSYLIREYVYQIAAHGVKDITHHVAIPAEIRRATIIEGGKLTGNFNYLKKFI